MLAARRAELATESLREIRAAIPVYGEIDDPALLADVTEHVAENHDALRSSLVRGQPVTAQDLAFIRPHAALRARRGVPLADFLQAFRIGHRVIWDAIVKLADEDLEARAAALDAARLIMEFIDHASTHAAQAYLEAQQLLLAEGDRVRRDLLEDLLGGREPAPARAARRGARLWRPVRPDRGVPVSPADDELALGRRSRCARHRRRPPPLTVVRQDEIVIVRALTARPRRLTEPVERVQRELAARRRARDRDQHRSGRPRAFRTATVKRAPRSNRSVPVAG